MVHFSGFKPTLLNTISLFISAIPLFSIIIDASNVDTTTQRKYQELESMDLGVRIIRPVYAIVPFSRNGGKNVTVVLTIWLKRVGAVNGPHDMPHQAQDAIRMFIWVDNPTNLFERTNGHLLLPTEHSEWSPALSLETAYPGPVLPIPMEAGPRQYRRIWGGGQRPYSYRVDLPEGVGDCFKIIEASYPLHKHTFCLSPAVEDVTCAALAPPDVHTPSKPALYTMIGPVRHPLSSRNWPGHYSRAAGRVVNYVRYHAAIGASGVMLYADELMRRFFSRSPELVELVKQGHLRLIDWNMPERSHNNTDGVGRPLGYNYDQGLFGSHNLLGLSNCGANLLVLLGDLDEFIYFPQAGSKWPEPWTRCMGGGASPGAEPITVHRFNRYETLTTEVLAANESAMWVVPGTMDTRVAVDGASGAAQSVTTIPSGGVPHPMARYDVVFATSMARNRVKQASLPAAWVVLFWVHEGPQLHGRTQLAANECACILHIANAFRPRRNDGGQRPLPAHVRRFRHWAFLEPGMANASLWEMRSVAKER